jgi:8-oxo-dGTP pyrophosphatase MutT (NUDIX family)
VSGVRVRRIDDIDARVAPFDWAFAKSRAGDIAANWRALKAEKPALYDGRVLLMSGVDFGGDARRSLMRSRHFETDFSAFLAWRDFGFPGSGVHNCFAMAALRGSDGGFILAEMGAHTANAGKIYFPAGTPDRGDIVGDALDLEGSVFRELEEETGLAPRDVSAAPDWLVIEAGPRVACMKLVRVDAPAREAARDIDARVAAQRDPELAGTRVIAHREDIDRARTPDFVVAYLERMFAQPG